MKPRTTPSYHESIILVKNLLKLSLNSVAFHRCLFAESNFVLQEFLGLKTRVIDPVDPQASKFQDWLLNGVDPCIEKGFVC